MDVVRNFRELVLQLLIIGRNYTWWFLILLLRLALLASLVVVIIIISTIIVWILSLIIRSLASLRKFIIFLLQRFHVLCNVPTEDVLLEDLSVKLLGLDVVARETFLGVRNEDTTVGCTFHGTEDTGTGGGATETDVKEALEWTRSVVIFQCLGKGEFSGRLGNTFVLVCQTEFRERPTSAEKAGSVSYA